MLSTRKKLAIVVIGSSIIGVGLGLAIAQQIAGPGPSDDGMSAVVSVASTGSIDPPSQPLAMLKRGAKAFPTIADIHGQAEAKTIQRMSTYRGTVINLQLAERVGDAKAQEAIAQAFERLDPESPARLAHFQWVSKSPGLNPVGWKGNIVKLQETQAGWLAEIEFSPYFAPRAGNVTTLDKWVEHWLYNGGTLQQLPYAYVPNPRLAGSVIVD